VLLKYEAGVVRVGGTPVHWPEGSRIKLDPQRGTLLLFTHPHCPCTRASIRELNRLLARYPERLAAHVFLISQGDFPESSNQTAVQENASAIPGATVQADGDGGEARRFGAEKAGYVVLYGPQGELLFKGGLTARRGQTGGNAGVDAVNALLAGRSAGPAQAPVYGCSFAHVGAGGS